MKNLFLMILVVAASTAYAHPENAGCKALHKACSAAKKTGKANMECVHSLIKGDKVDGVTADLTESIKSCKNLHEMHEHEDAPSGASPEAK